MIKKHWQLLVLCGIALGLFLIPNIFWGDLYMVGGDDSRLYYLFPEQYLRNFSFNVLSNNTLGGNLGYFPVNYSAPTVVFLYLLKQLLPAMNTQFLAYGAILAFGFMFFYKFLREVIDQKSPWHFLSAITASLLYILSPYITHTFFQHQIISIFLLFVVPGCLYLFTAGVKRKQVRLIGASALLYSIFSSTVYSLPWFLPVVITLLPFFGFLAWQYRRHFWNACVVFAGATLLYNFYWIIHFVIPLLFQTGETPLTAALTSRAFQKQNNDLIAALVFLNPPINQMVSHIRTGWGDRMGVTFVQSIGALFLCVILFGGTLLSKAKTQIRVLYAIALTCLLVAMLFVTPNFGGWSLWLFQFFNDHVPYFGMFRNMYDKFSLAMAFGYAFSLFMALVILGEAKRRFRYIFVGIVLLLVVGKAFPYIRPVYNDTVYSTRISGQMNRDFLEMTEYLKNMQTTSRFFWLPMTFPGYVYISDEKNPNHFYVGLSPLQLLSQKSDIAGFYGIQTSVDPELNWNILELLKNRSYEDIGRIFGTQNIGYIIVNHELSTPEAFARLEKFDFMKLQTGDFQKTILGEKIRDFGSRYSLLAINTKFFVPTVSGASAFQKLPDGAYEVMVADAPTQLVLLEPYNRLWKLEENNGQETVSNKQETISRLAYGYGNAWEIKSTGTYRIEFWPRKLVWPAIAVSVAAAVGSLLYIFIFSKRK